MLKNIKAVFIDLNGTLYIDLKPFNGAIQGLSLLRESGIKIRFITNNSKESSSSTESRLQKIGFQIKSDDIFSSLIAAKQFIINENKRPLLLLSNDAKSDFEGINCDDPNAVVVGLPSEDFSYQDLNKAFQLIMKGAQLIAINKARYYATPNGLSIAAGAIVSALEYSTNSKSILIGKPSTNFFRCAYESIKVQPDECVMIGDDFKDDIIGALDAGMKGILVKTGKYQKLDESRINRDPSLFKVAENIKDAIDLILGVV